MRPRHRRRRAAARPLRRLVVATGGLLFSGQRDSDQGRAGTACGSGRVSAAAPTRVAAYVWRRTPQPARSRNAAAVAARGVQKQHLTLGTPTSRALDPPPYGHLGAVASSRGMRGRRVFGPETQCGAWTQSMVERVAVGRPQAGLQRCDMGCRERRAHREGRTILIDVGTAWRHEKWLQPLQPAAGILGACP